MKATGIVRRIDDLGRVVIPKEIRRTMRIREGDPLEIYTDRDGEVIFKKYSPIGELSNFANEYADTLHKTCGFSVVITDRDAVIAVAGAPKKDFQDKRVTAEVEKIMSSRQVYTNTHPGANKPVISEGLDKYTPAVITPIITEGDVIGSVIVISSNDSSATELEIKMAQAAATFLGKQLES